VNARSLVAKVWNFVHGFRDHLVGRNSDAYCADLAKIGGWSLPPSLFELRRTCRRDPQDDLPQRRRPGLEPGPRPREPAIGESCSTTFLRQQKRWLWAPAFAGATLASRRSAGDARGSSDPHGCWAQFGARLPAWLDELTDPLVA